MSCLALAAAPAVSSQTHEDAEYRELLEMNRKLEEQHYDLLARVTRVKEQFETRINQTNQIIADLHRQLQLADREINAILENQRQDGQKDCCIGGLIGGGVATVLTAGAVILISL